MGSSFLIKDQTQTPCLGMCGLSHWTTTDVPSVCLFLFNITNLWREELFLPCFASEEKEPRAAKSLVPSHTWKGPGLGPGVTDSLERDKQGERKLAGGAKL